MINATSTAILPDETILNLANGMSFRSSSLAFMAGDYVRLCDAQGAELQRWDSALWEAEPSAVMAQILTTASGTGQPELVDGELIVRLVQGNTLRSGSYSDGQLNLKDGVEYVRLCDSSGEETDYWDHTEWQVDPELVMGAILRAATSLEVVPEKVQWQFNAGASSGGLTVGHLAKRNGNPATGVIIGLRQEGIKTFALLRYLTPQVVDLPKGETSVDFEVCLSDLSRTWRAGPTVNPHKRPGRQTIYPFDTATTVVPKGYSLLREVLKTPAEIRAMYDNKPVILVETAPSEEGADQIRVGVFAWQPAFSRWRHGGYYVCNVSYTGGSIGCISNNYPDKKWRIVCDPRRGANLNEPGDFTFPSRDAAARAELEWSTALKSM